MNKFPNFEFEIKGDIIEGISVVDEEEYIYEYQYHMFRESILRNFKNLRFPISITEYSDIDGDGFDLWTILGFINKVDVVDNRIHLYGIVHSGNPYNVSEFICRSFGDRGQYLMNMKPHPTSAFVDGHLSVDYFDIKHFYFTGALEE